MRDALGRAYATGRRKEASARVWVGAGDGRVTVNGLDLVDYFHRQNDRTHLMEPLVVTQTCGAVDIMLTVRGGGMHGQAGAVRHGLANALALWDPYLKPALRRCEFSSSGLGCAIAAMQLSKYTRLARSPLVWPLLC
jgi:small subunit ribosomal protein S9